MIDLFRCSGKVGSDCCTSCNRRVTIVTNLVISHVCMMSVCLFKKRSFISDKIKIAHVKSSVLDYESKRQEFRKITQERGLLTVRTIYHCKMSCFC
jgi:hypothetical protein